MLEVLHNLVTYSLAALLLLPSAHGKPFASVQTLLDGGVDARGAGTTRRRSALHRYRYVGIVPTKTASSGREQWRVEDKKLVKGSGGLIARVPGKLLAPELTAAFVLDAFREAAGASGERNFSRVMLAYLLACFFEQECIHDDVCELLGEEPGAKLYNPAFGPWSRSNVQRAGVEHGGCHPEGTSASLAERTKSCKRSISNIRSRNRAATEEASSRASHREVSDMSRKGQRVASAFPWPSQSLPPSQATYSS